MVRARHFIVKLCRCNVCKDIVNPWYRLFTDLTLICNLTVPGPKYCFVAHFFEAVISTSQSVPSLGSHIIRLI